MCNYTLTETLDDVCLLRSSFFPLQFAPAGQPGAHSSEGFARACCADLRANAPQDAPTIRCVHAGLIHIVTHSTKKLRKMLGIKRMLARRYRIRRPVHRLCFREAARICHSSIFFFFAHMVVRTRTCVGGCGRHFLSFLFLSAGCCVGRCSVAALLQGCF